MKVSIVIRFSSSGAGSSEHQDLSLPLTINFVRDDVDRLVNSSWLKLMIRNKVAETEKRRLRLIYNGRILNDQTRFSTDVFEPRLRQLRASPEDPQDALTLYIHCLIGEEMTQTQLEQEREMDRRAQVQATDPPVIGFDRLLSQGMSPSDVDDLRRQFHSIYSQDLAATASSSGVADVEEDERRQQLVRELEERWLESTNSGGGFSGARPSSSAQNDAARAGGSGEGHPNLAERAAAEFEGTHRNEHLLVGLLLGTFLGVVALVFLLMDDSSFNDAQKMAMVLGISINLFIAFLRVGTEYSA